MVFCIFGNKFLILQKHKNNCKIKELTLKNKHKKFIVYYLILLCGVENIMQELKFKNFIPSLFVFVVGISASAGISYIKCPALSLPVPLLIIGLFACFLVLNFISYPKATTTQIIQLTITGVFINAIVFIAAIYGIKHFKLASISLDSDFILSGSPLILLLSFLFSFIMLIGLTRFENKVINTSKLPNKKENFAEKNIEETKPEIIPFEENKISEPVKEENINKIEESITEKPKSLYEELYPQTKIETQQAKEFQKTEQFLDTNFIELEALPSLVFEENNQENKTFCHASENNDEEYFNFIPTDIRLLESPVSKDNESKGKISSIGKLLVNNRDIEGVIESNALISENENDSKKNILSSISGEQIYEKFNKLKQEFTNIKEIALIDKGGFIMASNFEDKMKINITGAVIAGAYHTLQNYLAQISFKSPQKIFFETENSNNFVIKTNDELLFSIWDKEFNHIDYTSLENFIENNEISESDLAPLIELNQLKNFAISDGTGKLIKSLNNTEDSEKLAIISAALFENLKVFLMNIQLLKLKRITIFNTEEVITIQKGNDKIASFITPIEGIIKFSNDFLKIEEISSGKK